MGEYVHMGAVTCQGQKRVSESLELQMEDSVSGLPWVLQTENHSSDRRAFTEPCFQPLAIISSHCSTLFHLSYPS